MITLSKDRKFVKVDSWTEITELTGFTEKLDAREHKLKEIIGRYQFSEKISCGLTTCRQPHGKGYIVSTKSGLITNIGHACGKTHFGIEFKELSKKFDNAVAEQQQKETVGDFMFFADKYKSDIEALRNEKYGADWLNRTLKLLTHKNRGCPDILVKRISGMVRTRNSDILIDREATEDEIRELEVIENRKITKPHYIEYKIGSLKGLPALYKENDLREKLVINLQEKLHSLLKMELESIPVKDLKHWSKWCNSFEQEFETIVQIVSYGRNLFKKDNLAQLAELLEEKEDKKEFKKFLTKHAIRM